MIKFIIIIGSILFSTVSTEPEIILPTTFLQNSARIKKQTGKENAPVGTRANYGKYEFTFKSLDGRTYQLKHFGGKITLVNIWAPWCEPCTKETDGLVRLYNNYHSKGFEVLGIAVKTTPSDVRKFINAHNVKWPVGINDEITKQYKPVGIPASYLFNLKGNLIKEFVGYADEKALDVILSEALKGSEKK